MGQMTFALMLGTPLPKAPKGKTWWGDSEEVGGKWVYRAGLLELHEAGRGQRPRTDENSEIVGFFVAAGASGMDGLPRLEGPIGLASAKRMKRYAASYKKAAAAWVSFARFCSAQGVRLGRPSLYLVETEVA
jgi:hypothetical protein